MKKWLYGTATGVILIAGTWVASPYWMMYQLKQAYQQQQFERVSTYIDYAQVRQSLEPQIESVVVSQLPQNQSRWHAIVRKMIESKMSQSVLDHLVSDRTLQLLMQGKQLSDIIPHFNLTEQRRSAYNVLQANTAVYEDPSKKPQGTNYHTAYVSPNRFAISLQTQDGKQTQFIFSRYAGWYWKMTAVDLGLD
ncbi:DUF2939 domain-containing protein [Acinetobacter sp. MD2]|uniref:DUF2939 domain-containing protein n=1 Tax=Acinetobacter sp. MD2 TaxID=2600066 RepID=UPI002D1EA380|nr:DUF2939 domain-containing protein [Acinetobacter sp. MD2]MEB3767966.1 DUF2939 domain-containing protein [Acinetobacter sp. MD2]